MDVHFYSVIMCTSNKLPRLFAKYALLEITVTIFSIFILFSNAFFSNLNCNIFYSVLWCVCVVHKTGYLVLQDYVCICIVPQVSLMNLTEVVTLKKILSTFV